MKDYQKNQINTHAIESKKTYKGIDACKLICAILVVVLHGVETSSWYPNEVKYVFTRFAVPFFFIASGFFFSLGTECVEDNNKYFIKYERRVLKTYLIWGCIIYLPFEIKLYINNNPGSSAWRIILLLFRRYVLIGPGPYWYLLALFLSIAVVYFCCQLKFERLLTIIALLCLLLEIVYTGFRDVLSCYSLFNSIFEGIYFLFSNENNFIMLGIPFVTVGYYIAKNKTKWTTKKSIIVFFVATAGCLLEYNLEPLHRESNGAQVSVCFIFQAIALFLLAKEVSISNLTNNRSKSIRQLSSTIYYSHLIFLYEILDPMLSSLTKLPVYADWMIAPKVIITLIMCFLFYVAIRRINNRHLNFLING